MYLTRPFVIASLVLLAGAAGASAQMEGIRLVHKGAPPIEISRPKVVLYGHDASIEIKATGALEGREFTVELRDPSGITILNRTMTGEGTLDMTLVQSPGPYILAMPDDYTDGLSFSLNVIPGWVTLLPPLLAIALALVFRQVVLALFGGVWVGAWIVYGNPFTGALRAIDGYVVGTLTDGSRFSIVIFTLLLGGMVGVMSRSGGTLGLVQALRPYATTPRRGQFATWLMGLVVFFDDYANTLLVGNTMRPVTDRLRISREKLAYIVDSTAAPVASIALISTWIGYEVSLIDSSLSQIGSDLDAYAVFIQSLPYRFYPLLSLAFGLMIAASMRDFGPMLKAERRAHGGKVLSDTAVPMSDFDNESLKPIEDKPRRWINAAVPVLVVLFVAFLGLWFTGRQSLLAGDDPQATTSLLQLGIRGIGNVLSSGDSFKALLYASLAGCITAFTLALTQRILSLTESMLAWISGIKSLAMAMVILILSWAISDICVDLSTSTFMVAGLSGVLDPRIIPVLVFLLAAMTSFATGTSWGTMGILIPLAVPTAFGVAQAAGLDAAASHGILLGAVSSVLAGAIFGDHCSPISDTTVLSSMATGCDHVDHVRTQLPYALLVAIVAMALGDLPSSFGVSPYLCLMAAAAALALFLRWRGRPVAG